MELIDLLCQMVTERRVVELRTTNDPQDERRIAEPHAVYIGSNNRGFVDLYQLSGYSVSGGLPGWRRFALSDLAAVLPLDRTFNARDDYRPENRRWYRAFVCTAEPPETGDQPAAGRSSFS
ncbi:MAG TPA: hypothetical protein PKA95_16730 [Thermomicrobiales bacterium]|nr:hypothetical protein [Thermomicrobiales bacterium]